MTQTFTQDVLIDGSTDTIQLQVQGHSTQTAPLQSWQSNGGVPVAQVTGDGRLQVGSFSSGQMATDDSLLEAHRAETDTSKPKRGMHTLGIIAGTFTDIVSWVVHELTLRGTSGVQNLYSALRVRVRNEATGGANGSSQVRGADIEAVNAGATVLNPVAELTGVRVSVLTESTGNTNSAYGVKVEMDTLNTQTAYAFHANVGKMRPGALLEIPTEITTKLYVPSGYQSTYIEELVVSGDGELVVEGAVFVLF